MANEINVTISMRVRKGNLVADVIPGNQQIDMGVARGPVPGTVVVDTTEAAVSFAALATLGLIVITNLDATNYIDFGPEESGAMVAAVRVKAGESCIFRLVPGTTYRAKANTAACDVQFLAFNA
jgi:hypothetical protein